MATYDARTIASWFILRNQRGMDDGVSDNMTHMKLLKLLYYADGCHLAIRNEPLFHDPIVAWEHGPAIKSVYEKYCKDPFSLPISSKDCEAAKSIEQEDQHLLEQVYQVFGAYSASGLRSKTHNEKPWLEATNNGRILKKEINRATMKQYFLENYVEKD